MMTSRVSGRSRLRESVEVKATAQPISVHSAILVTGIMRTLKQSLAKNLNWGCA